MKLVVVCLEISSRHVRGKLSFFLEDRVRMTQLLKDHSKDNAQIPIVIPFGF